MIQLRDTSLKKAWRAAEHDLLALGELHLDVVQLGSNLL
jgi:hypothetical protein